MEQMIEVALKPYCFLAEYAYYRGAAAAFSLREITEKACDLGPNDSVSITAIFQDGREDMYFDSRQLTRPTHTEETARALLIEVGIKATSTLSSEFRLGPEPTEETIATWARWAGGHVSDEEVRDYIEKMDRAYLSPDELDAIEAALLS
jgi:hypothetical protein